MQTKTYFAGNVPAALDLARQELGENALLVGSRPSPPSARQFGRLEVTFAWDPREAPGKYAGVAAAPDTLPVGKPAEEVLVEAGFSPKMAADIASGSARGPGHPDGPIPHELTLHELARLIPVAPFAEIKPGESRTLAFVGPPGRGKTISLIKIAMKAGLSRRVPVRIYSAGAHAIGAQEQLARLAAILGTPFQAFESPASLNLALNGEGWKGLALIDTPGISPADRSELKELKGFFAARPEIEKHLVLRADASSADMLHMMSRFGCLTPSRLLFTGIDEALGLAPMIETLIRGGIPATFAGTGQQIPEDLEQVSAERLARAVWAPAVPVSAVTRSTTTPDAVAQPQLARAAA